LAIESAQNQRGKRQSSPAQFARRTVIALAVTGYLLLSGHGNADATANSETKSQYTSLNADSCTKTFDQDDPDETPYLVCPGVAGYLLQVRQVESGRLSINVVNPAKRLFPLDYQYVVTRSMSSLDDKAEWLIRSENGKPVPIALIVRVMARENRGNPEKITSTYLAVAKITPDKVCVTDSIRQGSKPATEVRVLADSATGRPCASRLPVTAAAKIR
jgi:hypothetical protein